MSGRKLDYLHQTGRCMNDAASQQTLFPDISWAVPRPVAYEESIETYMYIESFLCTLHRRQLFLFFFVCVSFRQINLV